MPHEIDLNSRKYLDKRLGSMKKERGTFIPHYKELSEYIQPRRGRFLTSDKNKGDKRYNRIINSKATQAHRTARGGMFSGTMSPSRPWFGFVTPDPELMEFPPVKIWLEQQEKLLRAIFNSGNLYNMAPVMLGELLQFGTGCMTHVDDFHDVARFYTHTVGSYMIAQNERYEITTLVREFKRTTEQIVKEFGLVNVSQSVKDAFDRGDYDNMHEVVHFLEPNPNENAESVLSEHKPFRSISYEPGNALKNKFLRIAGFDEFPAYCPRWDVTDGDIYGTDCPGMTSLGDVKGLQIEEKRKAQAIDKMVNPPLRGPAALKNVPLSSLPGGANFYDSNSPANILAPVYVVKPQLQELLLDIQATERRIETAFFADLFSAITNMEGIQPRNELEIAERTGERLLQLGPVLERVHGDFLAKMVDRTFNQAVRAGLVAPAPEELQGKELDIRFISSLAMAQRAVQTGGIERLAAFVAGLAQGGFQGALDKFDADQAVDEFANAIGVPAKIVVPDEVVEAKRARAAQQEQMLMAQEAAKAMGPTAAAAGAVDLEGDNLISRAANMQTQ